MNAVSLKVETRPDEQGEELPYRFCVGERWVEVGAILDRWFQGPGNPEWPEANYFKVIGYDFREYLLKHDLESGEWFLQKQW